MQPVRWAEGHMSKAEIMTPFTAFHYLLEFSVLHVDRYDTLFNKKKKIQMR